MFYFIFILRLAKTLPTKNDILSLFLVAIDLQIALPPTVKLEMKAVNKTDIMLKLMLVELLTDIARTAPMEPLIIPQISPITSLQILEILLEFLSKPIVSLPPFIFWDAIDRNVFSLLVKTATPIISKMMPITIININIINKKILLNELDIILEIMLNKHDRIKVNKKTLYIQALLFIIPPI